MADDNNGLFRVFDLWNMPYMPSDGVHLELDGVSVEIVGLPTALTQVDAAARNARALLTGLVRVPGHVERERAEVLIDDVYRLLSLATGNSVVWWRNSVTTTWREIPEWEEGDDWHMRSVYFHPIRTGWPLIERWSLGQFLLETFPTYRAKRASYHLDLVLGYHLGAKAETFDETRFLLQTVGLEVLAGAHAVVQGGATIMAESAFEEQLPNLMSVVQPLLAALYPNLTSGDANLMCSKLAELNRPTWKSQLKRLFKDLKIDVSNQEIGLIVETRNQAVHAGGAGTDDTMYDVWWLIAGAMDACLLRLLEYHGEFLHGRCRETHPVKLHHERYAFSMKEDEPGYTD